jgi:mRNA-degrading endonuclease RelE of RelBE toxin-antitoxin system
MANVVLMPGAVRDIAALPSPIVARIKDDLLPRLRQWPNVSGVKRLGGALIGHYRLRTGDYRIQFRVERERKVVKIKRVVRGKMVVLEEETVETKVFVEKAGHRDGFYDE